MDRRVRLAAWVLVSAIVAVAAARASAEETTETGVVKVRGGELYHEAKGAGPAVVLMHGGLLDGRMWDGAK